MGATTSDRGPREGGSKAVSTGLLLAVGFLLLLCCTGAVYKGCTARRDSSSEDRLLEDLLSATQGMRTYHVQMKTQLWPSVQLREGASKNDLKPMVFNTSVVGETGKRMRVDMIPAIPMGGGDVGLRIIFDGVWQWIESRSPMGTTVVRLRIDKVSPDAAHQPFNTFYFIKGSGLMRGEDFPRTVASLLKMYDPKQLPASDARARPGQIVLVGQLREDRFAEYLRRTRQVMAPDTQAVPMKNESAGLFRFSRESLRLLEFQIGASQDNPSVLTQISYKSVNGDLPEDTFKYTPPAGAKVKDITDDVLRAISATQERER